ncbi:gene transfer agent family protein [Paracoccus aminovorans]|uniref:gene transfer agent family protein n=1 Tax=Paracoccus aminovorans TaxID=34004 RepID=UPI0007829CE7|nr:gene transfer agent family protein [Paracoccus aminovorans]
MNDDITLRAFFGDGERTFCLTDTMLAELERITGQGIGAVYACMVNMSYPANFLREIIRLGLIGAGTAPQDARRLVEAYADNRPLTEVFPVAFEILEARWTGVGVAA